MFQNVIKMNNYVCSIFESPNHSWTRTRIHQSACPNFAERLFLYLFGKKKRFCFLFSPDIYSKIKIWSGNKQLEQTYFQNVKLFRWEVISNIFLNSSWIKFIICLYMCRESFPFSKIQFMNQISNLFSDIVQITIYKTFETDFYWTIVVSHFI